MPFVLEGYCKDPFWKDWNNSGGGIIVYFSKHLIDKPRTELYFDSEAIWLEIDFPAYEMLLCAVYRQPDANYPFRDKLQQSVENATNYSSNVVITGDLYVDFLSLTNYLISWDWMIWKTWLLNLPEHVTRANLSLTQFLVSDNCNILESYVIQVDRKYSDHEATIVCIKVPLKSINTNKRLAWDYRNADFETCNECIPSFNWNSIISPGNNMDENCQAFTNKFIEMIKSVFHKKKLQSD